MKAKAVFTFFILMANLFILGQNQDWEIHIGLNNRNEGPINVIEYYDKGYYIDADFEINGHYYGWEIKSGINGTVLWDKILEHYNLNLTPIASTIDSFGNIYVCGMVDIWPFVTKFNACGEEQWCKIIAHNQYENGWATDILINEDNKVIVLIYFDSVEETETNFLAGLDTNGELLYIKGYASKLNYPWIAEPFSYDLMECNKEYYISGFCYWPFPDDTTHLFLRPFFIGVDSLLNEEWILPFYALDSVFGEAYSSIPLNDSVIMGVGKRRFYSDEVYSLLMSYNVNGQELGYDQIINDQIGPDNKRNFIRDIERINDSLFIAAAFFGPNSSGNPIGEFVIDTSANLYNLQSRPNSFSKPTLIKASDSNFVIASNYKEVNNDYNIYLYKIDKNLEMVPFDTNQYTYDSLCPEPIQSGTIDLTDCLVWTGTEEMPSPAEYYAFIATIPITAYPNPAEMEITLAFQNTEHHTNILLECYNIYGQKVHSEKIWKGQQQTKLDLRGWSKGLYFAVVKSDGKVAGQVRFIVQNKI
jgi:hypothetical protein